MTTGSDLHVPQISMAQGQPGDAVPKYQVLEQMLDLVAAFQGASTPEIHR